MDNRMGSDGTEPRAEPWFCHSLAVWPPRSSPLHALGSSFLTGIILQSDLFVVRFKRDKIFNMLS